MLSYLLKRNNDTTFLGWRMVSVAFLVDFIAVGFHADYQQCGNEEMEITEQKNQPNAGKRSVPPGIFPDEMTACIQKAFD